MGARSIGEVLAKVGPAKALRSFQPVRRNSYYAHDRRAQVWRPLACNNRQARRLIAGRLYAAEQYDRAHKRPGQRQGPLGLTGIAVLREFYRVVDFRSGRLEPSIEYICKAVKLARRTVVKALNRLKEHGFLGWVRRTEPTFNEGAGPQIRQITNAYWLTVPTAAQAWVDKVCGRAPVPDCERARAELHRVDLEVMLAGAAPEDLFDYYGGDPATREIIRRMSEMLPK